MTMMKKMFYFGLGAATMTRERAERFFDDMTQRGELSKTEARQFVDSAVKKGEEERQAIRKMIKDEIESWHQDMGMVSRSEFEALENRLKELEQKNQ